MSTFLISAIQVFGFAALALVLVILGVIIGSKRSKKVEVQKVEEKAKRTLSDLKHRMSYQRLLDMGGLDDIIMDEDDFEELVELNVDDFLKRQSKKFLECSLNLMAHSYESMDEARDDAIGILQLAFDDDIIDRIEPKDQGGKRVDIA
ncbi:hypothetical protein AU106_gp114 [Sinorhizobium phage phiM9]|uniref:Uncharacterized protein n=1 Tax=Sinorhizobium phage phiM9 TaxID=1636182 RepID=A0A0F6R5X4_9CAUD|nr:hypothetical protein AU106_gp114 [Sinorhizobium phage phiM9]AKE44745.1 hypothetical protein Sm_phiM9_117 [Sinorhizobium phage phiM9]